MLTIQVRLPDNHPADAPVFLAGTLNGWLPNDPCSRLHFDPDTGLWVLPIPQAPDEFQYKFTRGSWDTEEVDAWGQPIENRSGRVRSGRVWSGREGQDNLLRHDTISDWRDLAHRHRANDERMVRVWHEELRMPQLNRHRRIWVCVPPGYDTSDQPYPVVYMHDAQNLFGNRPGQGANWQVSRTLNQLFARTGWGCIVVGIEHGGAQRLAEYSTVAHPEHGGGEGMAYLSFLTQTLKPMVDAAFRTRPDAASTAMIGSSMGGLISVYAALHHGDVFGKVAAFSPSLWWSDDVYALAAAAPYRFVHKLVLLAGAQESPEMLPDVLAMYYTLIDNGYFEEKIQVDFYRDGTHSEWFWGRELERAIRWLFSNELPPMADEPVAVLDQTETGRSIHILKPFLKAELRNEYGKVICRLDPATGDRMPLKPHWRGLFALQCLLPNQRIDLKKIVL